MTGDSLLAEIERDLLDGKPLADLLRKCLILGARSGSIELREWAGRELRGYGGVDDADLPSYRKVAAPIMLDAVTGNTSITGQQIAPGSLPPFARDAGICNEVSIRQGIGEIEAWVTTSGTKTISVTLPGAQAIGEYIDKASGNPFQHIHAVYWKLSTPALHGLIDNVKTSLAELITELVILVPEGQSTPTAEQATQAWNVAVNGGEPHFHIAAPVTSLQASGESTIQGVTGGQTGVAGHDVTQTVTCTRPVEKDTVRRLVEEYRAALPEIEDGVRDLAEQQLDQVAAEIEKDEPHPVVVNTLLGSLKNFATNAVASAGAGAGTIGLTEVVAHWPF